MFFRTKSSGPRTYLQVVENRWEGGRSRQRSSPPWAGSISSATAANSMPS